MTLQVQTSSGASAGLPYADTEPNGVPAVSDPAIALLALILQTRGAQSGAAREDVTRAKEMIEQTHRQIQEAQQRAAEADEHSGFWNKLSQVFSGDIGALIEVVAAVAVIAATGGVGAVGVLAAAAAALSVSSDVAQHAGVDPKVCLGLSAASAIVGLAAGNVGGLSAATGAVTDASQVAHLVASAAATGATVASNEYRADALDARADATQARSRQTAASFDFGLALDVLEKMARDKSRAISTTSNIVQSENEGRSSLIARLGAA